MIESGLLTPEQVKRSCIVGLAREFSDDGDNKDKQNGFAFLSEKGLSMLYGDEFNLQGKYKD